MTANLSWLEDPAVFCVNRLDAFANRTDSGKKSFGFHLYKGCPVIYDKSRKQKTEV